MKRFVRAASNHFTRHTLGRIFEVSLFGIAGEAAAAGEGDSAGQEGLPHCLPRPTQVQSFQVT